jgi:hypothetical protein
MTQETSMKTVLFTLALLAQMTVQAAVPERLVNTTATADASDTSIVAQASTGGAKGTKGAKDAGGARTAGDRSSKKG